MKPVASLLLIACAVALAAQPPKSTPPVIQRVGAAASGTAVAVRVADVPLVFTGQVYADQTSGNGAQQAAGALDALGRLLNQSGSDLTQVVRLTAYASDEAATVAATSAVTARFGAAPPAFTLVRTRLPQTDAQVAFEAVSATTSSTDAVKIINASAAVLPAGGKIFISGQAEKGADLGAATRATMAGLFRTLTHLGLARSDVVQVKAFVRPMNESAAAVREISASFEGTSPPPIVVVEWQSDLFAEIELVVSTHGRPPIAGDTLAFSALPWLNKSPRYSHVVEVAAGAPLIFVGEIGGDESGDARTQLKTAFERAGSALFEAGGSFRTLAKATYYLGDAKTRAPLGDIRGVYLDPTRAPAASAIGVGALDRKGRVFSMDLIATPAAK